MTLLIYYTALYYWSAPLWLWVLGGVVWVLHSSWHHHQRVEAFIRQALNRGQQ
jgi:cytochrome c-type biogenesis protein CcmH/NrfF